MANKNLHSIWILLLLYLTSFAGVPQKSNPIINLWPKERIPNALQADFGPEKGDDRGRIWNVHNPTITFYPANKLSAPAVIICPGGGYKILACDHEGKKIAQWLNSIGLNAFILKYRLPVSKEPQAQYTYPHNTPLLDAQRAIRIVRFNAKTWNVDPNRIGIMGFSAGGHLASTAVTHFDSGNKFALDPIDRISSRPDFAILAYPVISFDPDIAHMGSRYNLISKNPDPKLIQLYSNEKQVTHNTPPTFLVHADDDTGVSAENSVRFYLALRKAHVPAEIHIYKAGKHGFGLGKTGTPAAQWPLQCQNWLKETNIISQ
jgi:acetyl esterase/lipase